MTAVGFPTGAALVEYYLAQRYRIVVWPLIGDNKGPREPGWPNKVYSLADYSAGHRVGIITGVEVSPGKFLHDTDIDWAPGSHLAQIMLPPTGFVFGRPSKAISHCFYTTPEAIASYRYEDIDKSCLIELRGTKANGELGMQTMVPPSVWTKDGQREDLAFARCEPPSHLESVSLYKQRVCLAAIGMLLAKHLGTNGFGHDVRLAWAGFLLRAGILKEDLYAMGEGLSSFCNNLEVQDVRRVVDSTAVALEGGGKKVKGGPSLAKFLGDKGKLVIARINEWLGRDSDFRRNSDGLIIKDSQDNIRKAMQLLEVGMSYQEFAERLLIAEGPRMARPLDDAALDNLWLRVDREFRFRPSFAFFEKVVKDLAHENNFHPVRDYFGTLTWDGTPRINQWLVTYGGAVDETPDSHEGMTYLESVSSIFMIAAVRRVRKPGCKYDEMLVLESQQGLNKSSALRALCPFDDWFSDDLPLNVDAKQIIERTLGKWIIEASDLVGGRKADRDHLKAMLSRQIDGPARLAYAHMPIERARQFVIIGTTNSSEYLADMTGARRFWPIKVQRFDLEGLLAVRDQLWAEAVVREAAGESIRLPEILWGHAGEHQEARREVDAWEDALAAHLDTIADSNGRIQVTADSLWVCLGTNVDRRDRYGAKRIAEIMQRFGFARTNVREGERVQTGYVKIMRSGEVREVFQLPDAPF